MHRLRTCAARLRPLTASQAAQTVGQQRPITATGAACSRTFQPIRTYSAPVASEPFLNGTSSNYVEEMYYAWLENPKSVHKVRRPRLDRGQRSGWLLWVNNWRNGGASCWSDENPLWFWREMFVWVQKVLKIHRLLLSGHVTAGPGSGWRRDLMTSSPLSCSSSIVLT